MPRSADGLPLDNIIIDRTAQDLAPGLRINFTFSSKPPDGYLDYYEKITSYVRMLQGPAQAIDPGVTAATFAPIEEDAPDSPFVYADSATSRAGIGPISAKLADHRIAIIGVGGTGSYILDLVAKTPVAEIHVFDDDLFLQYNAFRSPGAATMDELAAKELKVERHTRVYGQMHRGVTARAFAITADNVDELSQFDFVFLCIDAGSPKKAIFERLVEGGVPFVDAGLGIEIVDGHLTGSIRVTTHTPGCQEHLDKRVSLADGPTDDAYGSNIQVAELNALNAALAVIRWKKYLGFYADTENEHSTVFAISGNQIVNEDHG